MKLDAQVNGEEHEVQLKLAEDRAEVAIDERAYDVTFRHPAPGVLLLQAGNRVHECHISPHRKLKDSFEVTLHGRTQTITIVDPKRLRSGENSGREHHGSAQITAPMPGKVVRVLVEVGAEVEAGAGILVVEAMKMQNEMKTPFSGVVVSLNASPGDTVNAGDVLAVVE